MAIQNQNFLIHDVIKLRAKVDWTNAGARKLFFFC